MHPCARITAIATAAASSVFLSHDTRAAVLGGVDLGGLTDHHLVFTNGATDANWQGASKGFVGDVAINGLVANERTSGFVPYAGTIYTNDTTLGAWQGIVDDNPGQAFGSTNEVARLAGLGASLTSAFSQINALPATAGFTSVASTALDNLNSQNGIAETFVINVTSSFTVSTQLDITGDASDVYILRWDTDANFGDGYEGQVKFQSGGAIVPAGGLTPGNFVHVAGDIASSGGGSNPAGLAPYLAEIDAINGGTAVNGGGFFTGYWLTTGAPADADTSSLSNAIFVGGWYSSTDKFSMTSGTSGVYVPPVPEPASLGCVALCLAAMSRRRRRH